VTKIAFSDLVQIYRNTRFDGNGEGVLTVVNEEIVATLRAIEADERLYDEVQLSLINPESVDVGSQVRINVASPKLSLGILASDFDSLFSSPGAAF
jgi:16S rRNA A1518/A1519 N6-dimethyltransferase RsmA/KsgA/DIM1 with predicted DNA glycosylase/AP lyase activity